MHRFRWGDLASALLVVSVALPGPAGAQPAGGSYEITRGRVAGGATSAMTGGDQDLGGTAGQHDAGRQTGGTYDLRGGFWSGVSSDATAVPDEPAGAVASLRLPTPSPNPFAGQTTIRFALPTASPLRLDVYDLRGAHVATLARGSLSAGWHQLSWGGRDGQGHPVAAGCYFLRLTAGASIATRKVLVSR